MSLLLGMWNDGKQELTITRPNGQKFHVRNSAILSNGHQVFGVESVGNEVHVLTGPQSNRQPNRRVKFNDSGIYRGSSSL